jgi:hypothetical protein
MAYVYASHVARCSIAAPATSIIRTGSVGWQRQWVQRPRRNTTISQARNEGGYVSQLLCIGLSDLIAIAAQFTTLQTASAPHHNFSEAMVESKIDTIVQMDASCMLLSPLKPHILHAVLNNYFLQISRPKVPLAASRGRESIQDVSGCDSSVLSSVSRRCQPDCHNTTDWVHRKRTSGNAPRGHRPNVAH